MQVFPTEFNRPNLHALLHLSFQAPVFGSLRNLSVSTKEMVHRIYKEAVVKTNKKYLLRDLMVYENDMQALRFMGEKIQNNSKMLDSEIVELFSADLFKSVYLESREELLGQGRILYKIESPSNATSGNDDFVGVQIHGDPLSMAHMMKYGLLSNHLDKKQMGELFKAYESIGIHQILTNSTVKFFTSITYWVRGRATVGLQEDDYDGSNDGSSHLQPSDSEYRHVRVTAGDIVELLDDSPEGYYGRGFARVVSIMRHEEMAFFVLIWLIPTGRVHPRLKLPEFKETSLFEYAAFHPLSVVDHPRFVNKAYFMSLEGSYWLNLWVFDMV